MTTKKTANSETVTAEQKAAADKQAAEEKAEAEKLAAEQKAKAEAEKQAAEQKAKAEAEKKAAEETAKAQTGEHIEGIWVRSVTPSFRRAGIGFNRAGFGIALTALTDEQLEAIENEPRLVVERVTFEDESLSKPHK